MMKTLYFTIAGHLKLMVLPDTVAHVDGHPVITRTYSIFSDNGRGNPLVPRKKETNLHLDEIDDPEYFGVITFEEQGNTFSYEADGYQELSAQEVAELVQYLSNFRENPQLWNRPGDLSNS